MDVPATTSRESIRSAVREFFYREETPYSLALLRIALPLVLLQVMIPRWFHARELFSTDGAPAPLALNYGMTNFPPEPGGTLAVAMMTALVVSLCSAIVGWRTRPSLFVAFVLYTYLNSLDCLSTLTKYSVISSHLLLLLSVSPCGAVWSVDAWRRRRSGQPVPTCPVWSRRLMQFFIGFVYLGAACTKLHTDSYFSSDQLRYWLMTNINNSNPMGEWLSFSPAVVIAMAHIAIVWQIVFVFIVWRPVARPIVLGLGIFFHASTAPLLGLYIFPQVMIASYIAFLSGPEVLRVARSEFWRTRLHSVAGKFRLRVPVALTGGIAWLAALMAATVTGIAAESLLDPYGVNRSEGPHQLRSVTPELVERMRSPSTPVPFVDRVLTFDVGARMLGGVLLDSQSTFRRGERFLAQVSLAPPHEDVWLNCQLLNPDGHVVHESGLVVPRTQFRADWEFTLPVTWSVGTYSLVLRHEGQEFARHDVVIQ